MRHPFAVLVCLLTLSVPSVAWGQCRNGQCSASAYGYYPAAVYFVAPHAYAPAPAPFRQYGGSGRIYETWGDAGQLTAWIAANDPARAAVPANPVPSPVAEPVPTPVPPTPTPTPTPTPAVPMVKVKVHTAHVERDRLLRMENAGLTNVSQTYEPGYPIYGEIDPAKLNALRSLFGVIRIEVLK